jgi:hypothetical protein
MSARDERDDGRDHEARRGDEVPQDGLGRDAAHGDDTDPRYQGGSVGRSSGRAGDDDLLGLSGTGREGTARAADAGGRETGERDTAGRETAGREPGGRAAGDQGRDDAEGERPYADGAGLLGRDSDRSGGTALPRGADEHQEARLADDAADPDARTDARRRDPTTH